MDLMDFSNGNEVKVYPDEEDKATLACPKCGFVKMINVSKYKKISVVEKKNITKRLSVTCTCGHKFKCLIDFRGSYRKNVKLPGEFIHRPTGKKGNIIVENLSMDGLRFSSIDPILFKVGDVIEINFKLDDAKRSEIKKDLEVKSIHGDSVGGAFYGLKWYDKTLGFYLKR
jgi:hypothetical protein